MVYHHFSGDYSMSGSWVKFVLVSVFTAAMLVATTFSLRTLRDVMEGFSPSAEKKTDRPTTA
jgi:putative exporter of polyketide antibiotics